MRYSNEQPQGIIFPTDAVAALEICYYGYKLNCFSAKKMVLAFSDLASDRLDIISFQLGKSQQVPL